jgi:glycerophosphoryl diester phosphodiesterase
MSFIQIHVFSQKAVIPTCKNNFVVIAHRGNHVKAPENTLMAYLHAIDDGVDFVEIDLRTTKDNQLVIMHDSKIDRMTGYTGLVSDFLFDSLRQIKVFNKEHPEWGKHQIPSFKEVLKLCKNKINIYLDFKDASVSNAYNEILQAGMEKNIVVYINSPNQLKEWRAVAPLMPLMISLPKKIKTTAELTQLLQQFQIDLLDGSYDEYNVETVKSANQQGVPIWADIQSANESTLDWDKAIKLGLKGLQTDHPKALIDYLKSMNIR